MEPRLKPV